MFFLLILNILLCPFIIETSLSPPNVILANFLPKQFATLLAILVFPTPGGPTKRIVLPYSRPNNLLTAINSNILSLTSFNP